MFLMLDSWKSEIGGSTWSGGFCLFGKGFRKFTFWTFVNTIFIAFYLE